MRNGTRKDFHRDPEPIYAIQYVVGTDLIYGVHRIYGSMILGDHFCIDLGIGIANPYWAATKLSRVYISDDQNGRAGPAAAVNFRYSYVRDPLESGPNIHIKLGYFNIGYVLSDTGAPIGFNCFDAGFGLGYQGTLYENFLIGCDLTIDMGIGLPYSSNNDSFPPGNRLYLGPIVAISLGYVL